MGAVFDAFRRKVVRAEDWSRIQNKPSSLKEIGWNVKTIDYVPPSASLATGDVTGGADTTLVDSAANWTINEFVDKVCYIEENGDSGYGLIASNTSDTLTFDDDLIFTPGIGCTYAILHTRVLEDAELDPGVVLAVDALHHNAAIVLPSSTVANERNYVHTYLERGNGNRVPVMARGADRVFGAKYATLEAFREGMTIYAHQYLAPHWDIVSEFNVKRLASSRMTADVSIASTTYVRFLVDANTEEDVAQRFVKVEDGDGFLWWRYTSLFPSWFFVNANAQITKTGGGGGELTMTVRTKDGITLVDTDSAAEMSSRYGGGEGANQLSLQIAVYLKRNDQFTLVAKRDTGTFSVGMGTTFNALEA